MMDRPNGFQLKGNVLKIIKKSFYPKDFIERSDKSVSCFNTSGNKAPVRLVSVPYG